MELSGKKALVVGLRRTGVAAAKFLAERGASVTVTDKGEPDSFDEEKEALKGTGIKFMLGEHKNNDFIRSDLIVVSPGVPMSIPELEKARGEGVEVISEVELASRFIDAPMVGVTGTNGKSTVTVMIGNILKEAGNAVFVGGNIGNPLLNMAMSDEKADMAVVELSSFQLEGIVSFRPKVAVLLNISPDHLDRYPDMEAYALAKARIFMNQQADDWAVINSDDELVLQALGNNKSRTLHFSSTRIPEYGDRAWLDESEIQLETGSEQKGVSAPTLESVSLKDMKLAGAHNRENALAAATASKIMSASTEDIEKALASFTGLPHRVEFVRELKGVRYYDDSKGTNVGAVEKSLAGFDDPVVLIAGGLDKGSDYRPLKELLGKKARALVLMGAASEKINSQIGGAAPTQFASDMEDAVKKAESLAQSGDVVLLSPACASFDMFDNYGHRGDVFQQAVRELK